MTELEIRMYAIARTQTDPNVRIRWRGIGKCDWRNGLRPAYIEITGIAVIDIPGQMISTGKEKA